MKQSKPKQKQKPATPIQHVKPNSITLIVLGIVAILLLGKTIFASVILMLIGGGAGLTSRFLKKRRQTC